MAVPASFNIYKTFKGKYQLTLPDNTTKNVMLSCTNDVIFMHRLTSDANKLIGKLPSALRPSNNAIVIPVVANGFVIDYWSIRTNGNIYAGLANTLYYSEGISFNISSNFYA